MKSTLATLLCTVSLAVCVPLPAGAQADSLSTSPSQPAAGTAEKSAPIEYYNYANDQSEYSIMLPEAPTVKTIQAQSPEVKTYLMGQTPQKTPFLGEIATIARTNIDTEETFNAAVIFIKAPKSFLAALTEDDIKTLLEQQYAKNPLTSPTFSYSASSNGGALKWATLSGFTTDAHHQPAFSVIHYLTGLQSIYVVKVDYSINNKLFNAYYKKLVGSIIYSPP